VTVPATTMQGSAARDVRRGTLAIAVAATLFSSGGLFIKLAPLPPLAVACGRSAITALFFLLVYRPDLRRARLSTGLAYALMLITFVSATKLTTAANAIFLQYAGLVWVLLLAPWLLRERLRALDVLCVVASLGGMAILLLGGGGFAGVGEGDLIGALSGVAFAFTVVLLRRDALEAAASGPRAASSAPTGVRRPPDPQASTALGNLLTVLLTLPFATRDLAQVTPTALGVVLYLGTIQVGLAYGIFNRGIRHVPATRAGLVAMLEPALNPVWVLIGAGEIPRPATLIGGGIVLAVVGFRTLLDRPRRGAGAPAARAGSDL
jgi:drug/metabolite transporter (DMT)-like permease